MTDQMTTAYEHDYADASEAPCWEHGDEPQCNTSPNPTFYDVVDARTSRRGILVGGLAAAVTGVFGLGVPSSAVKAQGATPAAAAGGSSLLGFKAVPVSEADAIVVPEGYKVQVLVPYGTPLTASDPAYRESANTGAEQSVQVGSHHDGLHYFPIDGSSTDGLLAINHEYIDPRMMHAVYKGQALNDGNVVVADGRRNSDEVLKEINAHGVSVMHVRRGADGTWTQVDDPRNRRITGLTPMDIAGPVRGSKHVLTKYSPDGTRTRGTLNNCAHGVTPWNTYITAEENWAGYFRNGDQTDQKPSLPLEHARYGVVAGGRSRYGWELATGGADEYVRFDATKRGAAATDDYRNEPNTFGWMVEIDPFKPDSVPVKRTHLGRFAHEGVVFAPAVAGRSVVCYSGDDSRFEYIYKFVSQRPYDAATANGSLLDRGTLYAAKFNADGTGDWLALVLGQNGLTAEAGFADLADILVNTRTAADKAGATKMDRPEWGAVDPKTGEVYFTLTNNTARIDAQVDPVNPRAKNQFGQIVRWTEQGGDHTATKFRWELFVISGPSSSSKTVAGQPLAADGLFACPDGLWFDADARLWIQSDIGEAEQNKGDLKEFGNNAMLAADPKTGEIRRFLTGPKGQEITGVITTPDQRTMFVNVQHPGATTTKEEFQAGKINSSWPDGGSAFPRSATIVITRADGGKIGA